jgi:hypothetical protein
MKLMVELWEILSSSNSKALQRHIFWLPDKYRPRSIEYRWDPDWIDAEPPYKEVIASEEFRPELFGHFKKGEPVRPAWSHLQMKINSYLAGNVRLRFCLTYATSASGSTDISGSSMASIRSSY